MRLTVVASLASASIALGGVAHADDSLGDLVGPRELAVGEAMRGGSTGASAIGMNPAGIGLNRELVFEGGYGYRATDSASLVGASACDSTAALPGCFFYSYAGENPELGGMAMARRTHVGGLALSRVVVPRILLGTSLKYFHFSSQMPDEKSTSGVTFDAGVTVRMSELVNVGITGYNLYGAESTQFPRALGGGVLARPIPSLSLSFDARWRVQGDDTKARFGGGLEWFLSGKNGQQGYPIRAGALRDNNLKATYLTAGLGLASYKWGVDLGARRQVQNGHELVVMASMRFYGPREATPALDGAADPSF